MSPTLVTVLNSELFIQLVVFVVGTVLLPKLWQYIKLKADDKTRGYLEIAMQSAIRAAINAIAKTQNRTPFALLLAVANDHKVREQVMLFAKGYLEQNVPAALRRLKIADNIADMIVARIDGVVEAMSESFSKTVANLEAGQRSSVPIEHVNKNLGALGSDNPPPVPDEDANQSKLDL